MSEQNQTDDFAAIAKPHPAPQSTAPSSATPGDDFASIAKPHPEAADAQSDPLAMPTLHDLSQKTPEQEHEGLYHMKDKDGHSYAIPYSNVQAVPDWENRFSDNKELERYKQDHKEDTDIVSISKVRHNIDKKNIDVKKTGHFANDYLIRPAVNTANAAGRTIIEPVVDYIDNQGMSREEKEKQGQAEWEGSVFGKAEKRDKEGAPPATAKENLKDAAQIAGDMVPIMPVGTQGRQMAHDFTHGHKMDVATDLAGLGLVAGVTHGMAKTLPTEVPLKEGLRRAVGTDIRATEDLVRKTDTANKKAALAYKEASPEQKAAIDKVREENEAAKTEHDKKVGEIRKANEEKQTAHEEAIKQRNKTVARRVELSRKLAELKSRIFPKDAASRLKVIQDGAKQYFQKQYDTLSRLTRKQRGDLGELSSLLDDAESKIQGSDTNIAIFNDIRKRINGEISSQTPPPPDEWNAMSPEQQAEWRKTKAASGISYEDLRGYYRELGKLIGADATPGDIKTAAGVMRDGLDKMQSQLAYQAGLRAKNLHNKLSKEYRNYAETMLDKGSPVTKMLNAKDADSALKVFEGMTPFQKSYALDLLKGTGEHSDWLRRAERAEGAEAGDDGKIKTPLETRAEAGDPTARVGKNNQRLRNMRNYREDTAGLVRDYLNTQDEHDALGTTKPPPEPPKLAAEPEFKPTPEPDFPPPKGKTISPERLKLEKQEAIDSFFEKLRKNRVRVGVAVAGVGTIGLAEFISHALGFGNAGVELAGGALMAASAFGPSIMMKLLKVPGVVESLKVITKSELDSLAKLSDPQRLAVERNIVSMTQAAKTAGKIKPSDPTPLAKWAKADMAKQAAAPAETEAVVEPAEPERGAVEVKLPVREESSTGQAAEPVPSDPSSAPPPVPAPAASEPPPEPQPVVAAPPAPVAAVEPPPPVAEPRNDHQPSRRLEDLKVDPKRFQYKLGGNKQGVTDAMSDANWNQAYADPIHIWEDPDDGEEYVVNGHHRVDLAKNAGAERINVQKISNEEWPTAADARRFGALKNIADGNGTSVDAAKFMREKGYTVDDLRKTGLSLKKAVAKEGVALSKLSDDMFDRVVDGKVDPKIGAAIGEASDVASDQEAILKDVNRREKAGRPVTPEQIRESARLIKSSPTRTETTTDLFGDHEEERNLFLEMGEVSEYIQHELADEKRIFKRVASKGASDQLAKGKNVINPEENAKIAQQAAQQRELYLKRSAQAGPIHAALQEAAERLAEGGNPNEIKQNAFEEIRQHLAEELGHSAE